MDGLNPVSNRIWDMKYRLRSVDGTAIDATVDDTWRRVAAALSEPESASGADTTWTQRFFDALTDFKFLPAGRIISGAGSDRRVTLFNCFVMGTIEDNMGAIFGHLREAAITLQYGGGIGYDFSTLRPKGAVVNGVGADASGPVSFMDVWDSMCRTIMSAGSRRGAMMATLRCDHPDIETFIDAKADPARLRMFNVSVLVTDAFIEAVDNDEPWPLIFDGKVYRTIRARELWDRIMRATYDYAEPGVIFIDRINSTNTLAYCETIAATNPCGEQPLPPYGACLLGSINLSQLVRDPFTENARLDEEALSDLVPTAVRMLDNAIDGSRFPLPQQAEEARLKRRIGLGVTGLADALIYCNIRYGSPESIRLTERWLDILRRAAYRASVRLAAEKGAFPKFDRDAFMDRPMIRDLDAETRGMIAEHGIRNALLTSIAPTGTISLFANAVSSGIEPVFAFNYDRAVLEPDGSRTTEAMHHPAVRRYAEHIGRVPAPDELPEAFVDAQSLAPEDHLAIQAAAQRYIDSSISKTINCPRDITFERFKNVYRQAYALGCKSCTTYRPNDITGAVLTVTAAHAATDNTAPQCVDCG